MTVSQVSFFDRNTLSQLDPQTVLILEGNAGDSDEEELSIASKNERKSDSRMKGNGYGQSAAAKKPDRKSADEDDFVDDDDGDDDDMSGDDEGSNGSDF